MLNFFPFNVFTTPKECALPILRVSFDAQEAKPNGRLHNLFNSAIELAAFEYLEPRGCIPPVSGSINPNHIVLMIDLGQDPGKDWEVLIEERTQSVFDMRQIWSSEGADDSCDAHQAMDHHLRPLIKGLKKYPYTDTDAYISVRADLTAASAHKRLLMSQTRADMVQAFRKSKA